MMRSVPSLSQRRVVATLAMLAMLGVLAGPSVAQGVAVGFQGLRQDPGAPVEVTSDELRVDQAQNQATFAGNVLVVQGALRMSAGEIQVDYAEDGGGIRELRALGGVTVVTETEAAESQSARYTLATGQLVMEGDVLLTQGSSAIAGARLVADLRSGTGQMDGRVRTVFQPETADR